ncbi:sensor histidine kinase [Azospirillum agricola]|uniref:sensor histidine kinase n=1 Tax=Azospirillum agricola TaxID=1720247 RepID=UPI0015C4BE6A|nr:sensor histidine kinase [Azospirillum agricola]
MTQASDQGVPPNLDQRLAAPAPGDQPAQVRRMVRRLGIGAALLAVTVALLLTFAGYRAYRETNTEVLRETELLVETLSGHAARFIEAADLMLDRLRQLGEETGWSDPAQSARLPAELRRLRGLMPAVMRLGIWDAEGRQLASTEDDLPAGFSVADRPYFATHRPGPGGTAPETANASLAISEPLASQVDGSTIIVLSRRMSRPDGGFAGIVTLSFKPMELTLPPTRPPPGGPASVFWTLGDQRMLAAEGPTAEPAAATGQEPARRRVGAYPLFVEALPPKGAEFDRWLALMLPQLALGLVVLFGFGAGAWILLRWASAEDAHRSTLATLATRLRRSNADLEERVAERTRELSEAVAQRDLLMKEVNHRLKNSLQLACALVQMQGQTGSTPEVRQQLADTVARLQAIARVHDQLYQTDDVRRVEAAPYLRTLCADLEQSTLASQRFWRIVVTADPVDLPTDQAVPVGLMVNELVTNALKHGQPAEADGGNWVVEVGFSQLADGRLRLTVRDHGTGLPDDTLPRRDGSLGMKLLNGLTRQLNATLAVENAAPGARFIMTFRPQDVA